MFAQIENYGQYGRNGLSGRGGRALKKADG